jgi:thiol-disulfide isomerase/thioredoxin
MKTYKHLGGKSMHARLLAVGAILAIMFTASCTMNQHRHQLDEIQPPEQTVVTEKQIEPGHGSNDEFIRPSAPDTPFESNMAPDFALPDLDGHLVRLKDFLGKIVILDFWTNWCPPCRAEIPHFRQLFDQYRGRGLVIVGIALDREAQTVRDFAVSNDITHLTQRVEQG